MNKRTSILLSTTMASIATAACAFCVAQTANAASTSTSSLNASTVSSIAGVTSEKVSKDDSSTTQNLKSEGSSSANGGGSAFAKGSEKEVKTAEPKNTAEPVKSSEPKKTEEPAQSTEQSSIANSAQVSKPQQPANSAKDTKNPKTNSEKTEQSTYSASTGILSGNNSQNNNSIPQTLVLASNNGDGSSTEPVYDTEKNYKKVKEDKDQINYEYIKNPNKVTNPFPDVISDDEIADAFKDKKIYIEKIYFKPDATPDNPKPQSELVKNRLLKNVNGKYIIYMVYKNFPNANSALFYVWSGDSVNGTIARDGSIYAGSKSTILDSNVPFTFELNGYKIVNDSKKFIAIDCNKSSFANYLYIKLAYNYSFNTERITFRYVYCYQNQCDNRALYGRYTYFSEADAQFHFVDDLQYRSKNPNGVGEGGKLKERGNSDAHLSLTDDEKKKGTLISSVPFHKIEGLNDIPGTQAETTGKAGFYRTDAGDAKSSILSFSNDTDTHNRPKLTDLTGKNIPGYVYWDNDIDKPNNKNHEFANDDFTKKQPGNHYLSFAYEMKDGKPVKFLSRKHYYVTFRPIPTRLVVQYKGLDQQVVSSKSYAIYADASAVNSSLSSSDSIPEAPKRTTLVKMAENKDTSLLSAGAGYLSGGYAYLAPGIYKVDPTAAAPEGYEWVADSTDIANSSTSAKVDIEVNKGDTDSTQKVVTFVLRKKPTPPTPPTPPAPTPEPEPEPEPTPEPEPEPDIDWDDIPDIDLTPETDFPVKPDESSTVYVPFMVDNAAISAFKQESDQCSSEPKSVEVSTKQEQSYAPVQQKRPELKRVSAKSYRLSKTGSTATPILASAIASLFAGFAGLAESFAANRKRRN